MTKTQKAISHFQNGEYGKALSILKTFRLGFTKSQKRCIEIASDCYNGHEKFYIQIGIDVEYEKDCAIAIIKDKYKLDQE